MMATFMFVMIPRAAVCAERIGEVLDTDPSRRRRPTRRSPALTAPAHVELARRRVRATPAPRTPVLRDITFAAEPGETTAIIGSTGAGKTTLLDLVPRLFDVTGGIGAASTASTCATSTPTSCGARIGLVPQKRVPVLRHGRVEPALRRPGRDRRGALARARDRAGARTSSRRCRAARRADRAGRHERLRRAAPAPRDRAGARAAARRSTSSTTRSRRSTSRPTPRLRARAATRISRDATRDRRRAAGRRPSARRPDRRARRRPDRRRRAPTTSCSRRPRPTRDRRVPARGEAAA